MRLLAEQDPQNRVGTRSFFQSSEADGLGAFEEILLAIWDHAREVAPSRRRGTPGTPAREKTGGPGNVTVCTGSRVAPVIRPWRLRI